MANLTPYFLSRDDIPNYGFIVPVSSETAGRLDITTQVVSLIVETNDTITISIYVSIQEIPTQKLVFFRYVSFNYTLKEWINKMFNNFDLGLMATLNEFRAYYQYNYTSDFYLSMNQLSNNLDPFLEHWYSVILECLIKHYNTNK